MICKAKHDLSLTQKASTSLILKCIGDADIVNILRIGHLHLVIGTEEEVEGVFCVDFVDDSNNGANFVDEIVAFLIQPKEKFAGSVKLDRLVNEFVLQLQAVAEICFRSEFMMSVYFIVKSTLGAHTVAERKLPDLLRISKRGENTASIFPIILLIIKQITSTSRQFEPLLPKSVIKTADKPETIEMSEIPIESDLAFRGKMEIPDDFLLKPDT